MIRFFLGAVIALPLLVLPGCKEVKDPEFRRIENFGVRKLSITDAEIGFNVTYYNPNNFQVNVKEAEADVYIDSVYMGKFVQESAVTVPKSAEFSIPFSGEVSLRKALEMNFENLANREVLLVAEGSAKIGKGGIYISKDINYRGKHRLDEIKLK